MPAGWRYAVHEIGVDVDALDIRAADINDRGEIVGKLFCGERQANGVAVWRAFHWINGRTTLLSLLGGETSVAAAINIQASTTGRRSC